MKKLLAILFVLSILATAAYADQYDEFVQQQYDFEGMNDEQLQGMIKMGEALIRNAQAEIDSRIPSEEGEASTESGEVSFDTSTHYMKNIEYSIVKFEKDKDDGKDIIKMYVDWKNTGDEPKSLSFSSFMVKAYQSGKEVDSFYMSESGQMDNYMPGYGGTVFFAFENLDNTEMTFFIKEPFSLSKDNDWSFTVDISNI